MSGHDLTNQELGRLFASFEHTAFRLETRESYAGVSYDNALFSRWRAGQLPEHDPDTPWKRNVRAATAAGRRFERVRVVSEPWSDYTRYALWECQENLAAGEDIRYLSRSRAEAIGLPAGLPGYDYWLLDSWVLIRMHYDDTTDDVARFEIVDDPAVTVQHNYWRDAAWHYARPRDQYLRQVGRPVEPPSPANA
jgi:uncharacterized protein DUF6879